MRLQLISGYRSVPYVSQWQNSMSQANATSELENNKGFQENQNRSKMKCMHKDQNGSIFVCLADQLLFAE